MIWTNPSGFREKPGKLSYNPSVVVQFEYNLIIKTVVVTELPLGLSIACDMWLLIAFD